MKVFLMELSESSKIQKCSCFYVNFCVRYILEIVILNDSCFERSCLIIV